MIGLLAAVLLLWEPLRFAAEALMVFPTLPYRGAAAAIELVIHGLVAAVAASAGFSLWNSNPDAVKLAHVAVTAIVVRTVQSLYWSALPNNTVPGDEAVIVAVTIGVGLVMLAILHRARNQRPGPPAF